MSKVKEPKKNHIIQEVIHGEPVKPKIFEDELEARAYYVKLARKNGCKIKIETRSRKDLIEKVARNFYPYHRYKLHWWRG
jgi:aminoglycoside phosphotransferase